MHQIPPERAFWILDFYRRHNTRLLLAGGISDLEGDSLAITDVSASMQSVTVRLFDDFESRSWDRHISIGHVRYFFSQMGDPSFVCNSGDGCGCHSTLRLHFPDGAIVCLSERIRPIGPRYEARQQSQCSPG